jgi:hypothetical protein
VRGLGGRVPLWPRSSSASLLRPVSFGQSSLASLLWPIPLRPVFFGQSSLTSLLWPVFFGHFFGQSSSASLLRPVPLRPVSFGQYRCSQSSSASKASASMPAPRMALVQEKHPTRQRSYDKNHILLRHKLQKTREARGDKRRLDHKTSME